MAIVHPELYVSGGNCISLLQVFELFQPVIYTFRVLLGEQELLILPEHLGSLPVFSEVCVTRSLVLCLCFVDRCLSFRTFLLTIVLSVLLRYTASDYPFGISTLILL